MDFSNKKIYIAPHNPKSTMLAKELQEQFSFTFLGFIDSFKKGEGIVAPHSIDQSCDLILIYSPNHFNAIYSGLLVYNTQAKLFKVIAKQGEYLYYGAKEIQKQRKHYKRKELKHKLLSLLVKLYDKLPLERQKYLFIAKGSITSNNKALYLEALKRGVDAVILTDNKEQYRELKDHNLPVVWLESLYALTLLVRARYTLEDQANLTQTLSLLSSSQEKIQMWHGIPLKRLNKLQNIHYSVLISPSSFVNQSSLQKVIEAKEYKDFGYPRNDLLLKEKLENNDLLLCDKELLAFVQKHYSSEHKIAFYMPTHRESRAASKPPLDFESLNTFLVQHKIYLLVKMHHFATESLEKKDLSNILFHKSQGDIYPLLRYSDLLITDYSSVYFDYLLLDRPIIFFDYDKEEYEKNMQGFLYPYKEFTPGLHVQTQEDLHKALQEILMQDPFKKQKEQLKKKLFAHEDAKSGQRIIDYLQKNIYNHNTNIEEEQ